MARVSICTLAFDPDGYQPFDYLDESASDYKGCGRRASRTATLDGGAVVYDSGYSAADRTVVLAFAALTPAEQIAHVQRIVKTYSTVYLVLPDGLFLATPSVVRFTNGKATMTLLISQAVQEFG